MKNIENIKKVLDKIETNPRCWNQQKWHCGTSHCFAGHAQLELAGKEDDATVRRDARIYFGFTKKEADYYFDSYRTLDDLKTSLEDFYDRDGFNRDGFNRDGFNRAGFDRAGFNRAGFNRDGFNRAGFDRDGFDRDGLNEKNETKK